MTNHTYHGSVGVVIGRFQIHSLHVGHRHLIDVANKENDVLCILLGSSGGSLTKRNPLPFDVRKKMILERYEDALVYEIIDSSSWSEDLDALLTSQFPQMKIRLYGSRDSFAKEYYGKNEVVIVEPIHQISGTEIRNQVTEPKDTESFRLGMVESQKIKYPISYQTVDIVLYNEKNNAILLGRKSRSGRWCLPGGFVDPSDVSLECAALRELSEEVRNIATEDAISYLGSYRVQDHRYRNEEDKILTALFLVKYKDGEASAGDDLEEVMWCSFAEAQEKISDTHAPLLALVRKVLGH